MYLAKLKENKIGKFLSSVRLALILLSIIIIVSFIGAVLPSEYQPKVYYSWWFFLILAVFALNLMLCSLSRISLAKKKIGSTITHLSVLIILLGSLVSYFWGERGAIEFAEREVRDSFFSRNRLVKLNFKILLEDFHLEWYTPRYYKVGFYIKDKEIKGSYQVYLGKEYRIKGTDYAFSILDYFPDFVIDEEGRTKNLSSTPNNPAILISIKLPTATEKRWAFAKHPKVFFAKNPNIRFVFDYEPMIKEFRSTVKFIDGEKIFIREIKVNSPAAYKGYTFYQSGYDEEKPNWTSLEVVRDPGVSIVFIGFVLLNLGIILVYLQKVRVGRKQ